MKNRDIKEVYNYVKNSLAFIEAKNGVLIALNSVIIMGIIALYEKVSPLYHWLYFLAFLPSLLSLIFSLSSLYPIRRQKISQKKVPADNEINMFRSETIAKMTYEQLKEKLMGEDKEPAFMEQQKLNYILKTSVVTARKYRLFRCSLYAFSLYLVYIIFMAVFYFTCV